MKGRLLVAALCLLALPAATDSPRLSDERIVLQTSVGDVVLALYPEEAPLHVEQILRLTRLGVFDTTHFYRVEPGYLVQLSTALDRTRPLREEQRASIHPIRAEFGRSKHVRGTLSMARGDSPNSAETSFSILLGNAPHLDGKYTVFGRVEQGMEVVDRMTQIPRDGQNRPTGRIEVHSAEVVESAALLSSRTLRGPQSVFVVTPPPTPAWDGDVARELSIASRGAVAGGLLFMVLVGAITVLAGSRISPRHVQSLILLNVLTGSFLFFLVLVPVGRKHSWVAAGLFLGVLLVIKLMGRFEVAPE